MRRTRIETHDGRIQINWVDRPAYLRCDKPYKWMGLWPRPRPMGRLTLPCACYYTIDGVSYRDTILPGYEWDGASVPRALWPVGGHPFSHDLRAAGLFHDMWYQSRVITRHDADHLFGLIIEYFGGEEWHRELAVRWFGLPAWLSGSSREVAAALALLRHEVLQ